MSEENPFTFKFVPCTEKLSAEKEAEFSKNYILSYVYLGNFKAVPEQLSATIQESDIQSPDDIETAVAFIEANYYAKFTDHYPPKSILDFRKSSESYFKIVNLAKLYRKNGKIVGCILANHFDPYPPLGHATLHIGYSGYERTLVTVEEARYLKSRWTNQLNIISKPNVPTDASIAYFNFQSAGFFTSRGFKIVGFRQDPKDHSHRG